MWLAALLIATIAIPATTGIASADRGSQQPRGQALDLPAACNNHPITAGEFKPFAKRVWDLVHWERKQPGQKILDAYSHKLMCSAGPGHKASMKKQWSKLKTTFYKYRKGALWRRQFKPFVYPDGKHWAVPYPIAWCESGGDYFVGPSGAYGLIPPFPQYLSPKRQDEIAHRLYLEQGEGPWAPYEGGCIYR